MVWPEEPMQVLTGIGSSGQTINVPVTTSITGARTIVGWIDPTSNTGFLGLPIVTGGTTGAGDFFGVGGTGGENWAVPQYHLYVDNWGSQDYQGNAPVTPNQWSFVAMTVNSTDTTAAFYINGNPAGVWTSGVGNSSGPFYNYSADTYVIGGNTIGGSTTAQFFDGSIKNVAIYDTALTPSQIAALYNPAVVPEFGTLASFGGLIATGGLALLRRRRKTN
jgi:hypothetical protein